MMLGCLDLCVQRDREIAATQAVLAQVALEAVLESKRSREMESVTPLTPMKTKTVLKKLMTTMRSGKEAQGALDLAVCTALHAWAALQTNPKSVSVSVVVVVET
jgi:hypothetical protein